MAKKILKKKTQKKSVSKSKKPASIEKKEGVQPLGDRVLVRPLREEEKKIGALIIPVSGEKQAPDTGTVLAVGKGRYVEGRLIPMQIHAGDKVMFSKYSYDEIKVDGEDLYIMREENILAVLNK